MTLPVFLRLQFGTALYSIEYVQINLQRLQSETELDVLIIINTILLYDSCSEL